MTYSIDKQACNHVEHASVRRIFRPSVEMTFVTVIEDKQRLHQFFNQLEEGAWRFDLSQVNTCDSAGVALLIEAKRLSQRCEKQCEFYGLSTSLKTLIKFFGVEEVLS